MAHIWSHGPYEAICGHMAHMRPYGHIWACVPYVTIGVHQSRPWLYAFHQATRLLLHFALAHTSDQRPCHYTQKGNNHSRIIIWYRTATLLLSNTLCTYYSTTITTPCILINLHLLGIDSSVAIWYRTVTLLLSNTTVVRITQLLLPSLRPVYPSIYNYSSLYLTLPYTHMLVLLRACIQRHVDAVI